MEKTKDKLSPDPPDNNNIYENGGPQTEGNGQTSDMSTDPACNDPNQSGTSTPAKEIDGSDQFGGGGPDLSPIADRESYDTPNISAFTPVDKQARSKEILSLAAHTDPDSEHPYDELDYELTHPPLANSMGSNDQLNNLMMMLNQRAEEREDRLLRRLEDRDDQLRCERLEADALAKEQLAEELCERDIRLTATMTNLVEERIRGGGQ